MYEHGQLDHFEGAGMAAAVHMSLIAGGAEHRPAEIVHVERRWNGHAVPLACDGVAQNDLFIL